MMKSRENIENLIRVLKNDVSSENSTPETIIEARAKIWALEWVLRK